MCGADGEARVHGRIPLAEAPRAGSSTRRGWHQSACGMQLALGCVASGARKMPNGTRHNLATYRRKGLAFGSDERC